MPGTSSICVRGANLNNLDQEAGGLRMQRVPPTERRGRVHTSTVTVAVIDQSQKQTFVIAENDLQVEWFSGTGKGGQHRNRHMNSCRLKHQPSGLVVTSQTRSRVNSYQNALETLTQLIQKQTNNTHHMAANQTRKIQIGSGERGDKIRTIRFQDDMVVDHRTGKTLSASKFMQGNMDQLWTQLNNIK